MPVSTKPVIFLAFANDREDNAKYLRNLPMELSQIREALKEAEKNNLCEVVERANVSINAIFDVFQDNRYRDRIAIFHYGGHAGGYQLLLETLTVVEAPVSGYPKGLLGSATANSLAHGEGLVSFLSKQKGLTLVFFNGCTTEQQAQELAKAGIPAVIGTSSEIDDTAATQLATRFYKGLGQQIPLQQAWEQAIDEVKTIKGDTTRGLYRKESKPQDKKEFPWEMRINKEEQAWVLGKEKNTFENIANDLEILVAEGELEKALKIITQEANARDKKSIAQMALLQLSNFKNTEKQKMNSLLSEENYQLFRNRIVQSILYIISELSKT